MATTRIYGYSANSGLTITGTTRYGNIYTQDFSAPLILISGVSWFMGPDEDLGYIICNTYTGPPIYSPPTVTTTSLSNITTTTIDTGGNVTNDGGDTNVIRGICYNTTGTPTTGDTHTHNGTGTGSFTSSITGLTASTIYYVRSYATNGTKTGYGTTLSGTTLTPPPKIGDTYQGGIVFYITAPTAGATSGTAGLISKTTDRSGTGTWGCYNTWVSGADGTAIGTGNQNTIDIHNQGCSHVPVAANYCYDLTDGTYADWWLPSKNELNQMVVQKSVIGGFVFNNYWSSSEDDSRRAWAQTCAGGNQLNYYKNGSYYVRAVRGF